MLNIITCFSPVEYKRLEVHGEGMKSRLDDAILEMERQMLQKTDN